MSVTIPNELKSRSTFLISIALGLEKGTRFSQVSTVIRTTAKYIDLPKLTVSDAKTHSLACKTSLGTNSITNQTISVDTKTDNSQEYCEDDFNGDEKGFKAKLKDKVRKSIMLKVNKDWATNVLAGATAVSGTVDLSTSDKVSEFLSGVAVDAGEVYFDWAPSVDKGTVVQAKFHGRAFVIAGTTAYKTLLAKSNLMRFQSTPNALKSSDSYFESAEGVIVINAGDAFTDPKQLVYGVAGAPVLAYRADSRGLKEFDKRIDSIGTAGADSGDLASADPTVDTTYVLGAEIWNKALVPSALQAYVKKQLMA